MIKAALRAAASRRGWEVRRTPAMDYGVAATFASAYQTVKANSMLPEGRLRSLYDQVAYLDSARIPGAFVECGVWKGGAVGLMALASGGNRDLHLFDSFTHICEPDAAVDGQKAVREAGAGAAQGRLQPVAGIYDSVGGHGTIEACRALLIDAIRYPESRVHFHPGWFQDTMPTAETGQIALLRIDGDWYASTKTCLENLYDRVAAGGIVIIDDYGTYDGCKRATDEFLSALPTLPHLSAIDAQGRYFIKP